MAAATVLLGLAGPGWAHAYLERAAPAPGEAVVGPPEVIELAFTMGIEPRFSTIELFRLEVDETAAPADPVAPTEREVQRLSALAGVLVREARNGGAAAEAARVEVTVSVDPPSNRIVRVVGEGPLEPGIYVVVWEVLARDGHVTRDHHVFLVLPAD